MFADPRSQAKTQNLKVSVISAAFSSLLEPRRLG
jgi:hypothetical protein